MFFLNAILLYFYLLVTIVSFYCMSSDSLQMNIINAYV